MSNKTRTTVFTVMLVAAVAALVASFVLTLEKFHLLANPDAVLSCSINVVLNCATVMQSWQASPFGFPSTLIGLMTYPVVITIAVLGLAKVALPKWFVAMATAGFFLGFLFSEWMFYQTLYEIQVMCPWCLVVTGSTTILFGMMLYYALAVNAFRFSEKVNRSVQRFLKGGYLQMILFAWLAAMVALVFIKFGGDLFA